MRKNLIKKRIMPSFLALTLTIGLNTNMVKAIEFDPSSGKDDEIYKEYTAELVDMQINTIMGLDLFDDEEFEQAEQPLALIGSVKINKKQENGDITFLNELPEVTLVDENNQAVGITELYCDEESLGKIDRFYLDISHLNIEENKSYKLLATIKDGDKQIEKYVTYSDEIFFSMGNTVNMTIESINNIATISFSNNILHGDLDKNGCITANDAALALDIYKNNNATADDIKIGDMDGNNVIDAQDAAMILDMYKNGN